MKKLSVLLFGISLLSLSFYGLFRNIHYIDILMNLSQPYMFVRIALVSALATYVFIPWVRIYFTKSLLAIGGLGILATGLVSFGSPTLLGQTDGYMLLGDTLTLIEGGILAIVLSSELPARRTWFIANSIYFIKSLLTLSNRKLTYTSLSNYGKNNENAILINSLLDANKVFSVNNRFGRVYAVPDKATL